MQFNSTSNDMTTISMGGLPSTSTGVAATLTSRNLDLVDMLANMTGTMMEEGDEMLNPLSPAEWIIVTMTPLTVVFGTIGNLLTMSVLLRLRFRVLSINTFLIGLAAADTAFLWSNSMTRNFIKICFGMDFSAMEGYTNNCHAYVYILYVSKCLSAWFTVAVTIQRLLVVVFPYKAKTFDDRKTSTVAAVIITVVVFGIYAFIPYMSLYEVIWVVKADDYKCQMKSMYKERHFDVILKTLDLLVYSLFPTVILTFSNAVLIYKLGLSMRFRQTYTRECPDTGARRLTFTLTLVSTCFLICTVPMSSFLLHAQIYRVVTNFDIFYRSFYALQLINSSINFLLYCASGPSFRNELRECGQEVCRGCSKCHTQVTTSISRLKKHSKTEDTPTTATTTPEAGRLNTSSDSNRQSVLTLVWTTSTGDINLVTRL